MKHKFGAKRCTVDDKKFSSKLEARFFIQLQMRQKAGDILFFLTQVPFSLPGNIVYRLDFMIFHSPKDGEVGEIEFVETKGFMTDSARIKLAQVEDIYGIKIRIVKAV